MTSEVFWTDPRAGVRDFADWANTDFSLLTKLETLFKTCGCHDWIEKDDLVALKVHFGDRGTTRGLRSVFVRKAAELVREAGGRPFATETCGLGMVMERCTAPGRLAIAAENGFTQETLGAPLIIADGLLGLDGVRVPAEGEGLSEVWAARGIWEADKVILLSHLTGHMGTAFGGAIKHLGIGCVTKATKYALHCQGEMKIDPEKCNQCGACVEICPVDAVVDFQIDTSGCVGCTGCAEVCPTGAVEVPWTGNRELSVGIGESTAALLKAMGRDRFFGFNFLLEVTPHCDCCAFSDRPIVPDLGVLASSDLVALDRASLDQVEASAGHQDSLLPPGATEAGAKKFETLFHDLDARWQLEAAERHGAGSQDYRLIRIE